MDLNENINRIKQVMGVLNEQTKQYELPVEKPIFKERYDSIIRPILDKVKQYYLKYYSDKKNISKFKYNDNVNIIKQFIPTIDYKTYQEMDNISGLVTETFPTIMYLNVYYLFDMGKWDLIPKPKEIFDTIFHEVAHLIDYRLQSIKEKTIERTYNIFNVKDNDDEYIESDTENYARIQTLRLEFGISPNANGTQIKHKILAAIKQGKIIFPGVKVKSKGNVLQFIKDGFIGQARNDFHYTKDLKVLDSFFQPMVFNGRYDYSLSKLFAKFSTIDNNSVFLDLDILGRVNISVVDATKKPINNTQPT
jgi:hypothetical protein